MQRRRVVAILVFVAAGAVLALIFTPLGDKMHGKMTVEDRLQQYGASARSRLTPDFAAAGVQYPPQRVVLVGIKKEKVLHLYAGSPALKFVKTYAVLAASGRPGPKLREGDGQVPEGIYRIVFLNPNSRFHLSLRLDYPNDFDRRMGEKDGRTELGKDIMIHGSDCSIGCLAMGDAAAEDLFVLAAETGIENVAVILSPVDFRTGKLDAKNLHLPDWTGELYATIAEELRRLPKPPHSAHN